MKKKLVIIILIMLLTLCFAGCSKVDFTYMYTKDGQYKQIIDIWLDKDISNTTNYTNEEALIKITEILKGEDYTIIIDEDDISHIKAYKTYNSQAEMRKDTLENGLLNSSTTENKNLLFKYKNTNSETIFDKFFMFKIMAEVREKYDISLFDFTIFDLTKVRFSYNYVVPFKSVTSDADNINRENGYYEHSWDMSNSDNDINFTVKAPRKAIWYLIAIFLALITLVIVSVISVINNKQKCKNLNR